MRTLCGPIKRLFRLTATVSSQLFRSHSQTTTAHLGKMKIVPVPALSDNYMYLLIDEVTKECAVVDPVQPDDLIRALEREKVNLSCVMTTHHHWDHAGGNEEFVAKQGGKGKKKLLVYGGDDRIGALTNKVVHNDSFKVGNLNVTCLFTPCHTKGHICYYVTEEGSTPAVFTGDTLFSGGCGRFFEGTPPEMYQALIVILRNLPPETQVFCGHEYTIQNLKYAVHVEKNNPYIQAKMEWAQNHRAKGLATVPTTIEEEMKINPFMRVDNKDVMDHTGETDPIKVMGSLRKEKDNFKAK